MPDYSATSSTGLTPYAGGLRQLTTGRNADAGLTFFRHSDIPAFTIEFSSIIYSIKGNTSS
jgi:hypothetical protein